MVGATAATVGIAVAPVVLDGGGALFPPIAESRTMNPTTPPTIHGHFRVFFGAGGGPSPAAGSGLAEGAGTAGRGRSSPGVSFVRIW
jgi:hypothetical protein